MGSATKPPIYSSTKSWLFATVFVPLGMVSVMRRVFGVLLSSVAVTVTGVKCAGDRAAFSYVGAALETSGQKKYAAMRPTPAREPVHATTLRARPDCRVDS